MPSQLLKSDIIWLSVGVDSQCVVKDQNPLGSQTRHQKY
jgi:hypothetical protein